MSKLKEWIPDFAKKAVYDVLKWGWGIIRGGVAIWLAYLALFTDYFTKFDRGSLTLGIIIGAFIVALLYLGVELFRRFSKTRPRFPRLDCDFEVLEFRNTYDHKAVDKMVYTKRKKLRALRNGLSRYEDRYNWTGRGHISVRCLDSHQTFAETERRSTWQYYEVKFGKALRKGDTIDVDVEWTLEDLEHLAVPFLSATIEEPTGLLSLTVKFPEDSNVTKVIEEIAPFIGAKNPFQDVEKQVRGKEHEFKPDEVKLLHHYELRWKW